MIVTSHYLSYRTLIVIPLGEQTGPAGSQERHSPLHPIKELDAHVSDWTEGTGLDRAGLRQRPGQEDLERGLQGEVARPLLVPARLHLHLPHRDQGLPGLVE